METEYEWDPIKAASNLRKHGVDFADAAIALEDDLALSMPALGNFEEPRYVAMAIDPHGRLLTIVYTCRGPRLRLISAREATHKERRSYEEGQ